MSSCLLMFICSEEKVGYEVNNPISDLQKNMDFWILVVILLMNKNACLNKVYILCSVLFVFFNERSTDMLEDNLREERYCKLELWEDINFWMIGRSIGRMLLWRTMSTRVRLVTLYERSTQNSRRIWQGDFLSGVSTYERGEHHLNMWKG